ncbi:MAG TPA: DNA repair protein RadA [Acidimicrobiales bacterium]|nr:DNA repair protein RadA [Acidimicrobiales bacterium]
MPSLATARARSDVLFLCTGCAATSLRWVGRCPSCGEWNTLAPAPRIVGTRSRAGAVPLAPPVALCEVSTQGARPLPTGVGELDRVLGGGVVAGSVTLVFGPPGIGKSTLLFQVLSSLATTGSDVLLASAEESLIQVSGRAARLGRVPAHLLGLEGPDIDAIEAATESQRPSLVVVDSLQSIADPSLAQPAGSLAQVRACVERLTRLAKSSGVPFFVVGHVTKDGDPAGPRAVEHLVDTVLSFDGDRHHALRVLTAVKHRFGPAGEVGIFEMREDGLRAVPDPGPLMLGDRMAGVPGSVVVPIMQGRRPLLVEVQALLGPGGGGSPVRPHTLGIDPARANLLRALLACRSEVEIPAPAEFFVAAVGGMSVTEPAADLAVALAMASVVNGVPVPSDLVAFGELGLAGEVRTVPEAERRLAEARRAGFTRALVPASLADAAASVAPPGLVVHGVRTLAEALVTAFGRAGTAGAPGTMPEWSTVPAASSR